MESYNHINYKVKPFFVSDEEVNEGFFYSKKQFFFFKDNEEEEHYFVLLIANSKQEFIAYCEENLIVIPVLFWGKIKRMQ
jgi:hypothetical protein